MFVIFDDVAEGNHYNAFLKDVFVFNSEYDHDGVKLDNPERYIELVFDVPEGGSVRLTVHADV